MKPRWIIALVIAVLVILAIRPRPHPAADDPQIPAVSPPAPPAAMPARDAAAPSTAPAANSPIAPALTPPSPANVRQPVPPTAPPAPGEPTIPQPAATPAEIRDEIDNVQFAIRDYRTAHGENPVGSNAEITKALRGDNPKQVRIPIPQGSTVNENGEMCDRWGTPYFFHQLSGQQMEIHSAGPDRKLGTGDDFVVK